MTKQGYTHVLAVIDRSGSMESIRTDTQGGFNTYVQDQGAQPGECRFTVVQFDNHYEVVARDVLAAELPAYVLVPRGSTALYDTIVRACRELGEKLAAMPEDERPEQVVVMILTDGHENASVEANADTVKAVIDRQTQDYSWTFTFLGANQDAILTAQTIGIAAGAALTYAPTGQGVGSTFAAASAATTRSRSGGGYSYTNEERSAAMGGSDGGGGKQ